VTSEGSGMNQPPVGEFMEAGTGVRFDNQVYVSPRGPTNDFKGSLGATTTVGAGKGDEDPNMDSGEEMDDEDIEGAADHVVCRVLVLGSHGVGKTTLTQQLLTSEYLANKETDQLGKNTLYIYINFINL